MDIYIVVSRTSTKIGKIVRIATKQEYNHVSISMDKSLKEMYSFSRKQKCTPLIGNLVKESVLILTSNYNFNIDIIIYKIPILEDRYEEIKKFIHNIYEDNDYYYNYAGAVALVTKRKITYSYKAFTCSEFVAKILEIGGYSLSEFETEALFAKQARKKIEEYKVYEGKILNYPYLDSSNIDSSSEYFKNKNFFRSFWDTVIFFFHFLNRKNNMQG